MVLKDCRQSTQGKTEPDAGRTRAGRGPDAVICFLPRVVYPCAASAWAAQMPVECTLRIAPASTHCAGVQRALLRDPLIPRGEPAAAAAMNAVGAHACTDETGFGLVGPARNVAAAQNE